MGWAAASAAGCTWATAGGGAASSIINSTFSGNRGANFASAIMYGGTLRVANSVFYNNLTGSAYQGSLAYQANPYAGGTINKGSGLSVGLGNVQWPERYNAQYGPNREDWLTGDVLVADAQLLPLASNGGPTPTQALAALSPARDIGLAPGAPATDQRGAPRVGLSDAGAFEQDGVVPSGPLPVTLTAFDARREGADVVLLSWATALETANAGFRVERRASGGPEAVWQVRHWVAGSGSSARSRRYTYADEAGPEAAYYRLAQLDTDSTATYSATVFVAAAKYVAAGTPTLRLFPNPAHSRVELRGCAPDAALELLNAQGQLVRRYLPGTRQLDVAGLAPGMYVVRPAGGTGVRLLVQASE